MYNLGELSAKQLEYDTAVDVSARFCEIVASFLNTIFCLQDPAQVQEEALASLQPESECTGPQACRVRVRLPDGQNLTRCFMKAAPLCQLRAFCIASSLEAAEGKSFVLVPVGPGNTPHHEDWYAWSCQACVFL